VGNCLQQKKKRNSEFSVHTHIHTFRHTNCNKGLYVCRKRTLEAALWPLGARIRCVCLCLCLCLCVCMCVCVCVCRMWHLGARWYLPEFLSAYLYIFVHIILCVLTVRSTLAYYMTRIRARVTMFFSTKYFNEFDLTVHTRCHLTQFSISQGVKNAKRQGDWLMEAMDKIPVLVHSMQHADAQHF
jgi:hypothetical protein